LTQALGVTLAQYGADVTRGALRVLDWPPPEEFQVVQGPRIGITRSADLPLRFWIRESTFVSR
jgi:DNA-3-methyladenine glycosylase